MAAASHPEQHPARPPAPLSRELGRLRWLAIVAPLGFLTIVAYLLRGSAHEQLHNYPGFILVLLALAVGVAAFSFAIFALIGRLETELVERNRQVEAMLAVGRAASSALRLDDLLDAALGEILYVTQAEAAEVWLADGEELRLKCQRGLDAEAFCERTRFQRGEGLPGAAAQSGRSVIVHDLRADPRFVRRHVLELGFQSFGAFPLVRGGDTLGVLGVASRSRSALSCPVEQRLLEGIGEQLALAIENAELHDRVLDAAVLEERERLGHELHDGLAQTLGYVNTHTLAIKKLLASGREDVAESELREMEVAARRAFLDIREAILGLRTSAGGLLEGLRAYAAGFHRLAGVEVDIDVEPEVAAYALPTAVEIQLLRIVQEALANVRKHAGARRARIAVFVADAELVVEVGDDGRGFDAAARQPTGWPHFGLQTMRERAEAIGGRLDLVTAPAEGTRVIAHIPLESVPISRHARTAR